MQQTSGAQGRRYAGAMLGSPFACCLVIEDHPAIARFRCADLARIAPQLEVAAASSLGQALAQLERWRDLPVCVLLDLGLPDAHGVASVLAIRAHSPQARIVVVSGTDDARLSSAVLAAGACGFVDKQASSAAMLELAVGDAKGAEGL